MRAEFVKTDSITSRFLSDPNAKDSHRIRCTLREQIVTTDRILSLLRVDGNMLNLNFNDVHEGQMVLPSCLPCLFSDRLQFENVMSEIMFQHQQAPRRLENVMIAMWDRNIADV